MGRRAALVAACGLVLACTALLLVTAWSAPLPERLQAPGSTVITYRDGQTAHVFLATDDRWRIRSADVDPRYIEALLRYEDKRFWWHPGTDPVAVARAVVVNLQYGRVMTGASTLTSQLVRVLESRPRSIPSKLTEMHRALTLEIHLSKAEILDAYLAFAPYGGNLEGVEAASLAYFGHSADVLSPDEIAVLLAVPQNPERRVPSPQHAEALREARDEVARFLLDEGVFTPEMAEAVEHSAVPLHVNRFPRAAPHLAARLKATHAEGARIPTTLDKGLQRLVSDRLVQERERLAARGIHNGAAIVVDSESREIRALVGNLGFLEEGESLQMSAVWTPRSPGSTLKPFLYARAIDEGRVLPGMLVADMPISWTGYAPQNYDGVFRGLVPLEEALSRSLNVPFVQLLADLGVEPFLARLRLMGVRSLLDKPGHYGLSLAAGGIELTPMEVAGLYTTLANEGRYAPLVLHPGSPPSTRTLFSPGAVFLTQNALRLKDRPDLPARTQLDGLPPQVAWKTGTSFGHRDAWAAGSGVTYTAVVWLGNLDYSPARALVGGETAGPILFDLLEGIEGRRSQEWPVPDDLVRVSVCEHSGFPVGEGCPHLEGAWAVATAVPTQTCPYHLALDVDDLTGEAITPACRAGRTWTRRSFATWPASVKRFMADQFNELPEPPRWAMGCRPTGDRAPPAISHPEAGQTAIIIPGIPASDQEIPFSAEALTDGRLSWFVDGEFLGTFPAEERVWWVPRVGDHEVLVVDEAGLQDRRAFAVRMPPH